LTLTSLELVRSRVRDQVRDWTVYGL